MKKYFKLSFIHKNISEFIFDKYLNIVFIIDNYNRYTLCIIYGIYILLYYYYYIEFDHNVLYPTNSIFCFDQWKYCVFIKMSAKRSIYIYVCNINT